MFITQRPHDGTHLFGVDSPVSVFVEHLEALLEGLDLSLGQFLAQLGRPDRYDVIAGLAVVCFEVRVVGVGPNWEAVHPDGWEPGTLGPATGRDRWHPCGHHWNRTCNFIECQS